MANIEFVSYDGKYPHLCMGVLELRINDRILKFGNWRDCDYPAFWQSGGGNDYNDDAFYDWVISEEKLPDFLKPYADVISKSFNENVPKGCCGGCN